MKKQFTALATALAVAASTVTAASAAPGDVAKFDMSQCTYPARSELELYRFKTKDAEYEQRIDEARREVTKLWHFIVPYLLLRLKTMAIYQYYGCPDNSRAIYVQNLLELAKRAPATDVESRDRIRKELIDVGENPELVAPGRSDTIRVVTVTKPPAPSPLPVGTEPKQDEPKKDDGSSLETTLGLAIGIPLVLMLGGLAYVVTHANELRANVGLPPLQ